MKKIIEEVSPDELTIESICRNMNAFNKAFEMYGGHKDYEVQAIEVLLGEIEQLKQRLAEADHERDHANALQHRINVILRMIEVNNGYDHTAWNSMFGIAQILTMPQSEFEAFLEKHPEYRP